jgi:rod shape-determining protein MreC
MNIKQFRFWFLLGGIFIAPLVLFSTKLTPWGNESQIVSVLEELSYPFTWVWQSSVRGVSTVWDQYVGLHDAAKENDSLRRELETLKLRLLDHEEQTVELNRLRKLAGFTEKLEDQFTLAEVLVGQKNLPFKTIRLSKGTADGIAVGMPVVTSEGVVGRVIRTGLVMSDVQLIVDFDSNIDILIQRNRVRGVLSGFAAEECRLHLQRNTEVRIGDTLITSGIVGSFPKGLPVGKIVKISFESDNVSQVITVEPWVDYRRLEEVIVLMRRDPEVERIAETAGAGWLEKTTESSSNVGG